MAQQAAQPSQPRQGLVKDTKLTPLRRSLTPAAISKPEALRRKKKTLVAAINSVEQERDAVSETAPCDDIADQQLIKSADDGDPLLRSYVPTAPSERIMQMLLNEPPLTYSAARVGPPVTTSAPRHFCCMCGYWGKIRCKNCHLRTCGLECYKVHEDSRCGAFF